MQTLSSSFSQSENQFKFSSFVSSSRVVSAIDLVIFCAAVNSTVKSLFSVEVLPLNPSINYSCLSSENRFQLFSLIFPLVTVPADNLFNLILVFSHFLVCLSDISIKFTRFSKLRMTIPSYSTILSAIIKFKAIVKIFICLYLANKPSVLFR